ncbi:MAG TPA: ABC transporter ATP-binding protein [Oligoflexus sp.]|uniref:ABC transporter ATP-binding protein n=1 Tax=Oligoflexus sp. TaxID=1971216 RepID=UPI002D4A668A|nr:ABC transporter ATP-binding protein [Oligoflexus sp.]HYX33272.1 ABC transporter ATP-binding protein [Oligoflexus sp.]
MPDVPLLELNHLHIARSRPGGFEPLVQNLTLRLERGQSLGLVGESGSGKSLTALAAMNLLPEPDVVLRSGDVRFQGQDLKALRPRAMNDLRGSRMAVIVQDALAALNPVKRVRVQMEEVFRFHHQRVSPPRIRLCLERAGLPDTESVLHAYPHELSGGMRQRLLLAMALLLEPDLLIADEPTTSLDVTLQARWVSQVRSLQQDHRMGLLFISHDLALVAELCERIAVLYKGQLMELAPVALLMQRPLHPYTQAMMGALPRAGHKPHVVVPPYHEATEFQGCPYAASCPQVRPLCQQTMPPFVKTGEHGVACHAVSN